MFCNNVQNCFGDVRDHIVDKTGYFGAVYLLHNAITHNHCLRPSHELSLPFTSRIGLIFFMFFPGVFQVAERRDCEVLLKVWSLLVNGSSKNAQMEVLTGAPFCATYN